MTKAEAEKLGREDAESLVRIARETPRAIKTPDPRELRLPRPQSYEDSPELPARRIATDWDDRVDPDTEVKPPSLTKVGRAAKAHAAGEEIWDAYCETFEEELELARVGLVETVFTLFVQFHRAHDGERYSEIDVSHVDPQDREDSHFLIHSLYVFDRNRYESLAVRTHGVDGPVLEEDLLLSFVPTRLDPVRRWLRKRERQKELSDAW